MAKKAAKATLAGEIARLYGLPLGEFTAARNRLAAELKKAGKAAESEEVRALAKPGRSAWAVNQLFQAERPKMEALLAAGEQARAAQRRAVAGRGAEALREALQDERALRDELRAKAGELLAGEGGRAPAAEVLERVATDLDALALNPDAAEAAARGWLDVDLDPPGFEVLAGFQLAAASVPKQRPTQAEEKDRSRGAAAGAHGRAPLHLVRGSGAAKGEEASAERRQREREETRHRERRERAEAKVAAAEEEARSFRLESERAEKAEAEAVREATAAARRAEAARGDAERARERMERAEERLARARKDFEALGHAP